TTINDYKDPTNPNTSEDDNLNVTLSGDSSVVEGEEATYKVSLKDDKGNSVEAIEDMVVSFKYTYTTASGEDITEVKTVTVLKGQSEASFKVSAVDDTYKEGNEKFEISIVDVTNIEQFEKVTIDKIPIGTIIKDDVDNVNIKIEGIKTNVVEGESVKYKVTLTDDEGNPIVPEKDVEVSFTYSFISAKEEDIVRVSSVTIPKGSSEVDLSMVIKNDPKVENSENFTIAINNVSNIDQFEKVTIDKRSVNATIVDNDSKSIEGLIDEDGLVGTKDLDKYLDVTTITGKLGLNADSSYQIIFSQNQSTTLQSNGKNITLQVSSNGKVLKAISEESNEIFEISIDDATNSYTFILKSNIDHPNKNIEDILSTQFNIQAKEVSTGNIVETSVINIKIADDSPDANTSNPESNTIEVEADEHYIANTYTNLVIVFDTSGSMTNNIRDENGNAIRDENGNYIMRIDLANKAVIKLIEEYDKLGDVRVKIIDFDSNGKASAWYLNAQDVVAAIENNEFPADGGTNYTNAMQELLDSYNLGSNPNYGPAPLGNDQDIFYFISDGESGEKNFNNVKNQWQDFSDIFDSAYSIGIGSEVSLTGVNNNPSSLNNIVDGVNGRNDPFVIKNEKTMVDELYATIVNKKGELTLENNVLDFIYGADGPYLGNEQLPFRWGDKDLSDGFGVVLNEGNANAPTLTWKMYHEGRTLIGVNEKGELVIKVTIKDILTNNPTYTITLFQDNTGIEKIDVPFIAIDREGDVTVSNVIVSVNHLPNADEFKPILDLVVEENMYMIVNTSFNKEWQGVGTLTNPEYNFIGDSSEEIRGDSSANTIYIGGDKIRNIDTYAGDDKIKIEGTSYGAINTGDGNDEIEIAEESRNKINLGQGDNKLKVHGDVKQNIYGYNGDDQVIIKGDLLNNINYLGNGNNQMILYGNANAVIDALSGDDKIYIGKDATENINLGDGNNILEVGGSVSSRISVPGAGENIVKIHGNLIDGNIYLSTNNNSKNIVQIDGKIIDATYTTFLYFDSNDGLILNNYSYNDYLNNVDNIKTALNGSSFYNVDNVRFNDGRFKGNPSIFNSVSSDIKYNYKFVLSLEAILKENDVLGTVKLTNIPNSVTSFEDIDGTIYNVVNNSLELTLDKISNISFNVESLSKIDVNVIQASVTITNTNTDKELTVDTNAKSCLEGTKYSDNIIGSDADEYIDGKINLDTINAGKGNDTIVLDINDISVDGSIGVDTLSILYKEINLDIISSKVKNIEALDLENGMLNDVTIDLQDILDMTDDNNMIKIFGDENGDKVTLEGGSKNWVKDGTQTIDGETFSIYKGSSSSTSNIKVLIDEDIKVDSDI
ncbi:VWA domain-containing protein, partial [Malaciobacter mytili]|uniref:hypothetical protein n=1 Tax=Malaciobacter mytili TaxID=603050 RepID=UPI003BAE8241